jgi:hypothetical protein
MKKVLASITVLCYLLLTTGVVVNYHYCMKRLASVTLYAGETKVCGRCGMGMHQSFGCCHDEVEVIRVNADQNMAQAVVIAPNLTELKFSPVSDFLFIDYTNISIGKHHLNHSPPLLNSQDTYLQNCVFRI